MCLGSDNTVKDNCLKSSIDTPINLFHNGTGSKANNNLHAPKSYDNTSFYVRSLKGFSQGEIYHNLIIKIYFKKNLFIIKVI